ncbi:hypothetical protein Y1Q_0005459 [Alligator mississippiensis]|uniref:Uncharacterized protein n=1 Tax=Alligator mississippiensis TaxID=8496 RepID=A0A151MEJ6_ALLMI|nr:hypothetical protein Y1Q_0005459 [Alligator mississippiensis]
MVARLHCSPARKKNEKNPGLIVPASAGQSPLPLGLCANLLKPEAVAGVKESATSCESQERLNPWPGTQLYLPSSAKASTLGMQDPWYHAAQILPSLSR